jgi:RNA polymerase sigma factor for flagellar operon FliA
VPEVGSQTGFDVTTETAVGSAPRANAGGSSRPSKDPSVNRLWDSYKDTGDPRARERLILQYSPLVKYVAGRVSVGLPNSVEHGDLTSYGMFGLIDAIEKFDLAKGFKFETYAIARIKGAIIDELRSIDWIPRSVRSKAREVEKALTKLETDLGRTPSEEELAGALDTTVKDLRQTLAKVSLTSLIALDESFAGEDNDRQALVDTLQDPRAHDPQDSFAQQELRQLLNEAVNRMPEREKTVIVLYYFEGMTLAQIGEVMGVTESRVCQLHTKAVLGLRAKIVERHLR